MAFCTECGSKLPEDAVFCPNCGSSIKTAPASAVEAPEEFSTAAIGGQSPVAANDVPMSETVLDQPPFQSSGVYTQRVSAPVQTAASGLYPSPAQNTYTVPQQTPYVPNQGSYIPPQPVANPGPSAYGYPPYPGAPAYPAAPKNSGGKVAAIVISSAVVLLVLAAILIFKPFGGSSRYVGYWETVLVDVGDGVISQDYYGTSVVGALSIQINSDNSAYLASVTDSDVIEGTWEKADDGFTITTADDSYYFEYDNKQLLFNQDDVIFYFDKIKGHDINNPTVAHGSLTDSTTTLPGSSVAGSGSVGNGSFSISVIGAEDFIDVDGDPAIRIYYDFTNNYTDYFSLSAWDVLSYYATQDGSYLTETYSSDQSAASNASYRIRPGITMQCCSEFKYSPGGGSVDFSVYGYNDGESGGTVSASYIPGSLPGAPAPYVLVPVTDPQWTLNIPSEGNLDSFYVAVLDAELIDDYNGDSAIRVYYSFTNNSNYSTSLGSELSIITYQDGVSLDYTYAPEDSETDSNYYIDVAPGGTITVSCVFVLRNEASPVEAEVEAYTDYAAVGQTYNIAN